MKNELERGVVLLLTATINPGNTPLVARRDPATRLGDYQAALRVWLNSNAVAKIVFCENSAHDLSSLRLISGEFSDTQVEFLSFNGNQGGAPKGKGYAEVGLLEHALENSQLISGSNMVIKCTGRLTLSNSSLLAEKIGLFGFDIMCDLKRCLSFADSRIFAATPDFIADHLLPQREIISDAEGVFFEHALACATASAIANRKKWRPFPLYPKIEGISGTFSKVMTEGLVKRSVKSAYHRVRTRVYET